jgi:hypothetical protein
MKTTTMNTAKLLSLFITSVLVFSVGASAGVKETVTVDNFVRAETDMTLDRYVKQGAFGKFLHLRVPTPIDRQDVIRMNRDTLYSFAVLDLNEPATIVKPGSDGRYQLLVVINQDHSMPITELDSGEFELTKEKLGSRYVFAAFRTFVDAGDPDDVKAANALQDKIGIRQKDPGSFEIPDWDEVSLKKLRDAILVLAATRPDFSGMFGIKEELDPLYHLMGTASGWGGNPPEVAMYDNVVPAKNDGKTPHSITVEDVPVDGFWSVTVYNKEGFMEENDEGRYSFNNVAAEKNKDGSITINFGGDKDAINNLPIMPGWNYTVRMYIPQKKLLDGSWKFPRATPTK